MWFLGFQDRKPLVELPPMPQELAEKAEKAMKEDKVQEEEVSAEILKARTSYYSAEPRCMYQTLNPIHVKMQTTSKD